MSELLETCELAARAGASELIAWRGRFQTREKAPADLVTDADLASQAAIRAEVAARFPHHLFVGEEKTSQVEVGEDDYVWLVDPLDGTTNYIHGYPCYAVSIAVARGRELLAGVIFDPLANELYFAEQGRGAWCNGERLKTSGVSAVGEALVAVEFAAARGARGSRSGRLCPYGAGEPGGASQRVGGIEPRVRGPRAARRVLGDKDSLLGRGRGSVTGARGGRCRDRPPRRGIRPVETAFCLGRGSRAARRSDARVGAAKRLVHFA